MVRARTTGGSRRIGFVHGVCDLWLTSAPSLSSHRPKTAEKGISSSLRGFLRQVIPSP
jgi:hypothetical protein